ncbi:MAG: sigma 54-interacting transcriptional regulator [Pseudomonadota bacterium]
MTYKAAALKHPTLFAESQCIGREQELAKITDFYQSAKQAHGTFVAVTGPRGIGKSLFLTHVQRLLSEEGAFVMATRCRPGLPSYWPVAELVRCALVHLRDSGNNQQLVELAEQLLHFFVGGSGNGILQISAASDENLHPISSTRERINLFDQMAELLYGISSFCTTVVVFHDLDVADQATQQLVDYLARNLASEPELPCEKDFRGFFVTSGTALKKMGPIARWSGDVHLAEIELDGLDEKGVKAFLSSQDVVQQVLKTTGGVPHALDSLVRNTQRNMIPPLSVLQTDEERLLRFLAVVGHSVGPEELRSSGDLPHPHLARIVLSLIERGILEKTVIGGELRIAFAKIADQNFVYDSIPKQDREKLHTKVGLLLQERGAEHDVEACAEHLLRGNCKSLAFEIAKKAGQRLETSFCYERAADLYERVLDFLNPDAEQELREKLCAIYEITGQLDRAIRHAERLLHNSPNKLNATLRIAHLHLLGANATVAKEILGPMLAELEEMEALPCCQIQVLAEMAEIHFLSGETAEALELGHRALRLRAKTGDGNLPRKLEIDLKNTLGKLYLELEEHDRAQAFFESNLDLAKIAKLPNEEIRALIQLGMIEMRRGHYEQAGIFYGQAREQAERIGEFRLLGACMQHQGVVAERMRDYKRALDCYQKAVSIWKKVGIRGHLAWVALDLGKLYFDLGDVTKAMAVANLAEKLMGAAPPMAIQINLEILRARFAQHECRLGEARHRLIQARDLARAAKQKEREARVVLYLVELLIQEGELDVADSVLDEVPTDTLPPHIRLRALHLEASIHERNHRVDAARRTLGELLELAEVLKDPEASWQARFLLARVLGREGKEAESKRLLKEAALIEAHVRKNTPEAFLNLLAEQSARTALSTALAEHGVEQPSAISFRGLRIRRNNRRTDRVDGIIGNHPRIQQLMEQIEKVAVTNAMVLVRGESGTGKELVADAIHRFSGRANRPLVKVNCGALVESLLLSELFGHERGAFTGATQRKLGRFEAANGGTLFLDEIGDISANTQVALLRVLQEQTFERVGGTTPIQVDVRIICATNKDLQQMVVEGRFREDLYYRLKGVPIDVPPLRERAEDVPLLAEHFLMRIACERETSPKKLGTEAGELLKKYRWPGNVRELENMMRSVSLFSENKVLDGTDFADFAEIVPTKAEKTEPVGLELGAYYSVRSGNMTLRQLKKQIETSCIRQALDDTGCNITKAAELLGMKRPRLSQLIKEYGMCGQ